jgi:hypothetical protein
VHGVENRIAGLVEADRRDDLPIAIRASTLRCERCRSRRGGCRHSSDPSASVATLKTRPVVAASCAPDPLSLEHAVAIEQLQPRVLAIGDDHVGAAGHEAQADADC